MKIASVLILGIILLMSTLPDSASAQTAAPKTDNSSYSERVTQWRTNREEGLKKEGGWLSVAGLHWLNEGNNSLGTGAANDYVLPAGSAPESVGVITFHNHKVTLKVTEGTTVTVNGKTITDSELKSDASGSPDRVKVGDLTFTIIQRGKRIGIRLWHNNSPARKAFTGLKWYPVDESYRVTAKLVPFDKPKKVGIANILGEVEEGTIPGYLVFTLNGQEYRLEPQAEGDELFINFKDTTNGDITYPPGRFLYAQKSENGQYVLDFNQAYNPPCAFTAFATCPLPPAQNRLKVAIPAGEKKYHSSEEDFVPHGQGIGFAEDIAAFQKADKENPPKKGQILFIGSSIIRMWTHLQEQFAPLPVFNRGFGGSRTWEVLHYADDIALPYEPRVIVYYCGSNDINSGEKAEAILERYRQFSDKVTERLPDTIIYYVSIFRAPQKKDHWDIVDRANQLIRDYSAKTKNRQFIDANPIVFDAQGKPRMELYQPDGLHFTDATYVELAALIKPILQESSP